MSNTSLAAETKKLVSDNPTINVLEPWIISAFQAATDEFLLTSDELIDVKRIPVAIVTFDQFIGMLKDIREELNKKPGNVKTEDWDLAKSGKLKLYKSSVCVLHAISSAHTGGVVLNGTLGTVTSAIVAYAASNYPAGLSESGKKLWNSLFRDSAPRTKMLMSQILNMMTKIPAPTPPAASSGSLATGVNPSTVAPSPAASGITPASTSVTSTAFAQAPGAP